MTDYVLATDPNAAEQRRMELLFAYHGPSTLASLQAGGIPAGGRALEVGPGGGEITCWLADRLGSGGRVTAVDLETHWIEHLAGPSVEVIQGDFEQLKLPTSGFDIVVAQMLLIHLPDPVRACRRFLELVTPNGQIVIHDADFTPVALTDAIPQEAAGIEVMADVMREAGIDVAIGPKVPELLAAAGATIKSVEVRPCESAADGRVAAEITAITLDRFRHKVAAPQDQIDAAIAALSHPDRPFRGPTRWIVRARRT